MNSSNTKAVKAFTFMAILLALLSQQSRISYAAPQEQPLTNTDVVNLVKVGLGDDIVIAKVKEATSVAFQLDTDNLLRLKGYGVNERVIAAMLDRSSTAKKAVAASVSPVRLLTKSGELPLDSIAGSMGTTYAVVTMLVFADYPGKTSSARTRDRAPKVEIASKTNPTGRFYIVKADSNSNNTRSVKLGSRGMFTTSSHGVPDSDWTFPYSVTTKSPGVWEVALSKELEPGEYGVWSQGRFDQQEGFSMVGVLYDFGVD